MSDDLPGGIKIHGYFPGVIGKITEIHAIYYHENWGFDVSFEAQVGMELSEFLRDFTEQRDGFWAVWKNNDFAGCIAIDGRFKKSQGARLRWFIVEPEFHGHGVGSKLLHTAVNFCRDAGHKQIHLWTFKGLDSARKLYESVGFALVEEHWADQWGSHILEQKFELCL